MSKATPDMYYLRNVLTGMSRESRDQVATALAPVPRRFESDIHDPR